MLHWRNMKEMHLKNPSLSMRLDLAWWYIVKYCKRIESDRRTVSNGKGYWILIPYTPAKRGSKHPFFSHALAPRHTEPLLPLLPAPSLKWTRRDCVQCQGWSSGIFAYFRCETGIPGMRKETCHVSQVSLPRSAWKTRRWGIYWHHRADHDPSKLVAY